MTEEIVSICVAKIDDSRVQFELGIENRNNVSLLFEQHLREFLKVDLSNKAQFYGWFTDIKYEPGIVYLVFVVSNPAYLTNALSLVGRRVNVRVSSLCKEAMSVNNSQEVTKVYIIWSNHYTRWLAKPGYPFDYTADLLKARVFESKEDASKQLIEEYETIIEVDTEKNKWLMLEKPWRDRSR